MSEFEHLDRHGESPMDEAVSEAMTRLQGEEGDTLIDLTSSNKTPQLEKYIQDHPELSPEGQFYLQATIAKRKEKGEPPSFDKKS